MVQNNLFPHDVKNSKQSQRTATTTRAAQLPTRTTPQTGFNRQPIEQRNRCGYGKPAPKQYPQTSNRVTTFAPRAHSASPENGRVRLFGWAGRYFDVKTPQSGVPLATFSLATRKSTSDEARNPQKETVWHVVGETCGGTGAAARDRRTRHCREKVQDAGVDRQRKCPAHDDGAGGTMCGSWLVISSGSGKRGYVKYGCPSHRYQGTCSNGLMIRQGCLEAQLIAGLTEHISKPEAIE